MVEDEEHPGRDTTARTDGKFQKNNVTLLNDQRLSIRMVADLLNTNKDTLIKMLHEELNMTELCAEMISKNLTLKLKDHRENI